MRVSLFTSSVFVLLLCLFMNQGSSFAQDEKSPAPVDDSKSEQTGDEKKDAGEGEETGSGDKTGATTKDSTESEEKLVYADLKKEWDETDAKFADLEKKFNAETDTEKKAAIKKEYSDLTVIAKTLGEKLRTAALNEYKAKPNENEEITRLLIGMIVNDVAFLRYTQANEIANALIEGKADEKHFLALQDSDRISVSDRTIIQGFISKRQEADEPKEDKDKKSGEEATGEETTGEKSGEGSANESKSDETNKEGDESTGE